MGQSFADVTALTAAQAVEAMKGGELKAEDYARALLARERECRSLNTFISLEPERVLEAARAADKARLAGRPLGLLHGLPIPVKDSINTRDLPTTHGTRSLRSLRPRADAELVRRLYAQGAILMGKTNLHELSRGWTSNNGAFGAVRNAYDPERVPGGSSGGSASAVAAGIAPLAVAEDTWGSIRVPAAMCGVVGFRPTVGHFPNQGVMSLTRNRFDQVGPVARCVADVALFDAAVSGPALIEAAPLRLVRLGVPLQYLDEIDGEYLHLFEHALERLAAAGAVVVRGPLPSDALGCADIAGTIIAYESRDTIQAYLDQEGTGLSFDEVLAQASPNLQSRYSSPPVTRQDYEAALRARVRAIEAMSRYYEERQLDALVFPPLMAPAPPLGDNAEVMVGVKSHTLREVVGRNTALGNCASLSSLVIPAGLTRAGLPFAIELDAPAARDRELLELGLAVEAALGRIPAPARACSAYRNVTTSASKM